MKGILNIMRNRTHFSKIPCKGIKTFQIEGRAFQYARPDLSRSFTYVIPLVRFVFQHRKQILYHQGTRNPTRVQKKKNLKQKTMEGSSSGSSVATKDQGGNAPSGFVLKLFQMVNGAPDEVISVSWKKYQSKILSKEGNEFAMMFLSR